MDTKKLRQKILDLAIRGKLVPQDPNDEPASVLLERIRAEKERLIAEGKIKRPKKSKASSSESHYQNFEPPFEIPDSWEWVRVEEIGEVLTGNTPSKENALFYGGRHPFFKPNDLTQGISTVTASDTLSDEGYGEARKIPINSILVTCIGATIGKTGLIRIEGSCNQQINAIIPYQLIIPEYLYYVCIADFFQQSIKENASATTLPILNKSTFSSLIIPLPPLSEQKKIVLTLTEFETILNNLDNDKNTLIRNIFGAKSKILELAMQGKLVPQDPADEPSADMLHRINPKAKIITDNPHYPQLPNNWVIVKLTDLADLLSGRDMVNEDCNDVKEGIPYLIGASNIINGKFEFVRWTMKPQVISINNDILLSCKGTIGEIILNDCGEIHIARQFMAIRCGDAILPKYLMAVLMAQLSLIRKKANGIIPGISRQVLLELEIPLPPIAEQSNILKKLQMIGDELKSIQEYLN